MPVIEISFSGTTDPHPSAPSRSARRSVHCGYFLPQVEKPATLLESLHSKTLFLDRH